MSKLIYPSSPQMELMHSSWDVMFAAGEPHTVIRVQNLQTSAKVGTDAWGREGKLQPVLISATVALRYPFETASIDDEVDQSTIHYGILSKAILEAVANFPHTSYSFNGSIVSFAENIFERLIGHENKNRTVYYKEEQHVVNRKMTSSLQLKVMLPKASLLGSGVSVTETRTFDTDGVPGVRSRTLSVHDLRIPTLVGVNPNERLAKQIVVTNLEIDRWFWSENYYARFEQFLVKVSRCSSRMNVETHTC